MKVLCEPLPQARRHFTRFDQVEQLVRASEADPDLGFMGRLMALCSLPRTNPGRTLQYKRVNGPYTLIMTAVGQTGLPFGNLPRLLLVWVSTEAVRTRSRELFLGTSLSEFMCKLGLAPVGGGANGARTRLRNQMRRLFHCQVELIHEDARGERFIASRIADRGELLWNKRKPDQPSLWESKLRLGEEFFNEIIHCPFPLNMNIFRAIKRSSLGLDLYLWLTYRTFTLKGPLWISWGRLYRQFGVDPAKASDRVKTDNFRRKVLRELVKIKTAWPDLNCSTAKGVLILWPSKPTIAPTPSVWWNNSKSSVPEPVSPAWNRAPMVRSVHKKAPLPEVFQE